jgi:hypothetical protein
MLVPPQASAPNYGFSKDSILKVTFCAVLSHKNQSKFQNTACLLVNIQISGLIFCTDRANKMTFKNGTSLTAGIQNNI